MVASVWKHLRNTVGIAALTIAAAGSPAMAFNTDGVLGVAEYANNGTVAWYNGHGKSPTWAEDADPQNLTNLSWTWNSVDWTLGLFVEAPIEAKQIIYQDESVIGTAGEILPALFSGYGATSLDYHKATDSEQVRFDTTSGGSEEWGAPFDVVFGNSSETNPTGHSIVARATSLDWLIANTGTTGCDRGIVDDKNNDAFCNQPTQTMSFEFELDNFHTLAAAQNFIADIEMVSFHLSPECAKGATVDDGFGGTTPACGSSPPSDSGCPPGGCPVPEPSTLAVFGLGLAGLGLTRRRRRTA